MRHHHRLTAVEAATDVKSRIIFETPENTDRHTIARNRSFSGYKLDSALLQQTGQARHIPLPHQHIPQHHKLDRAERNSNLTVEGIKKKYGFSSSKPAPSQNNSPLQSIVNREKPNLESYHPAMNNLKNKYELKNKPVYNSLAGYAR